jgi:nitronate monooxygenase
VSWRRYGRTAAASASTTRSDRSPRGLTALLEAQLAIVAQERVPVLSFTFGIPPLESAKAAGVFTVGTATTVREAVELERAGVDAVVTQGSEAGGHRGTFVTSPGHPLVGLAALVPQVVDAVDVPVIAAGGLMDGRGIAAALALGADAAQLGTAFLVAHESAAHPTYKRAVLEAADDATVVTDAYTGRPARAVATPLIAELDGLGHVLPFPAQGLLTRDMHAAAAERGRPELMFLLSGQGTRLARALPAGELVRTLADETEAVLRRLTG